MEGLITFIVENPSSAIIVVALGLAVLFGYLLFKSYQKENELLRASNSELGANMNTFKTSVETQFKEQTAAMKNHSSDMGKFQKAITGDLLKTAERVFELKQEMLKELLNLKALSMETDRNLKLANEVSKLAITSLNEKLGKVVLIEKALDTYGSQISKLQEQSGSHNIRLDKQHDWFTSIGEALKAHKVKLETLERDFKHGKKG